jgi:hypothetical protein
LQPIIDLGQGQVSVDDFSREKFWTNEHGVVAGKPYVDSVSLVTRHRKGLHVKASLPVPKPSSKYIRAMNVCEGGTYALLT